jgi:hypothetical protein
MGFIRTARIRWAARCGKLEHKSGRLLGLLIAADILDYYYFDKWMLYLLGATFVCWLTYLVAHTLEKKLYTSNFRF